MEILRVPDGNVSGAYVQTFTDTPPVVVPTPVEPPKPTMPAPRVIKSRHMTDRTRILAVLCDGPATTREIADVLAIPQKNVSAHLSCMWKAGAVQRKEIPGSRAVIYSIGDGR